MIFHAHVPQSPLSEFVECIWFQEGNLPPHPRERLMPDGTMELVINLYEDRLSVVDRHNPARVQYYRGSLIGGPHSEFDVIDTTDQQAIMGVHFKPGGAFPFFCIPAGELHNAMMPLDCLWGASADDLRGRVLEADTVEAKFRALEYCLLERAVRPLELHPAVVFALNEFRQTPIISHVKEQIGLIQKRFIQVFQEQVGLTPKLYCRVRRFQRALRLIAEQSDVEWTEVALACGYFDQAHFNHDFRAFSGISPTAYVAQRGQHFNHVALWEFEQ
jgi:AraC-like DNA-binding protein